MPLPADLLHTALAVVQLFGLRLAFVFVSIGSIFSAASLAAALLIAALVTARRRRMRGRAVRLSVIVRALFPRGLWRRPSTRADVGFFLFNVLLAGGLTGWAIASSQGVEAGVASGLAKLGAGAPLGGAPQWLAAAITTVALFLAFELGYYLDHWLSHHVPALWALHKPHHSAQTLTPLTNFRVHPLESLVFLNIVAVTTGGTAALCTWAFAGAGHEAALGGRNLIFLGLWFAFGHLQHSNLWITFPGPLGRWLISPAHHQLHHSIDLRHHGKNLGSFLSLFDWVFGTLHHPQREREPLIFGVEGEAERHHTIAGGLIDPVTEALATLRPAAAPQTYAPALTRA